MIKDLVVNLTVGGRRDVAGPFAISIAETFGAHVAGVAFSLRAGHSRRPSWAAIPASLIEAQRAENDKAAADAIARFDEAAQARRRFVRDPAP